MDAYAEDTTAIPVNHADENVGNIGGFSDKTREVYAVTATANPPTEIQSGQTIDVDITIEDQWGVLYTTGKTANITWLGSDVSLNPTAPTITGSSTENITLTNDFPNADNTNQIQVNVDGINATTANLQVDGLSPSYASSQVLSSGNSLRITMDETLYVNTPSTGQFTVTATPSVGIIGTSVSGSDVTLTLDRTIETGETIQISYNGTGGTKIQDLVYNNSNTFNLENVTNNSTQGIAPSFSSAQIPTMGNTIVITMNETLTTNTPSIGQFSINSSRTVSVIAASASGNNVTLSLDRTIENGETIQISYDGSGATTIQDSYGNNANIFINQSVTNNSTQVDYPSFISAQIPAIGTTIIITMDEDLKGNAPTASQFSIGGTDAAISVTGASTSSNTVTLTLSRTIEQPEPRSGNLTISYDGSGATTIQDIYNRDANVFAGQTVTNNSTVTSPSSFSSAEVPNGAETTIVITFNESLETNTPTPSSFSVSASQPVGVSSTSVSGNQVTLNLDRTIEDPETVQVSYDGSGGVKVEDLVGNESNTFTNQGVSNNSSVSTPPTFSSAQVPSAGTTIEITMNENLTLNTPSTSSFSVSANATTNISGVSVSGMVVTLNLDRTIENGEIVQVTYDGTGATKILDLVGNNASPFTNQGVTNNSSQNISSDFVSAQIPAAGTTIVVTMNETLLTNTPTASQFTISNAAIPVTVSSANASGTTVTLNLSRTIDDPETGLQISYNGSGPTTIQDDLLNDANTFTNQNITNNSTQTSPPGFSSAQIMNGGTTLEITFDENLTTNSPTASQFTVNATPSVNVSSASASGAIVTLNLDRTIENGETGIQVSYDGLGAIKVLDLVGNEAGTFSNQSVTNNSTQSIPPIFVSALIPTAGTTIIITMNETLTTNAPTASQFIITNALIPVTVSSASTSGTTVTLNLSRTIDDPETGLRIRYNGSGGTTIQDAYGNSATTFTNQIITNNSTQTSPPTFSSAIVPLAGTTLVITFNETLTSNTPDASQFTLSGTSATVASTSASGTDVTLTLNNKIESGETVKVSYDGSGTTKVLDLVGNEAATFTNQSVTNNSSVPALVDAWVHTTNGQYIYLQYNESLNTTSPTASQFSLIHTGPSVNSTIIITTTISNDTVRIYLNGSVEEGEPADISYDASGAVKITDGTYNANAFSFGDVTLTNNTTNDFPPSVSAAEVPSSGDRIIIRYGEGIDFNENPLTVGNFGVRYWNSGWQYPTETSATVSTTDCIYVTIMLSTTIPSGTTVEVRYINSGGNIMQDWASPANLAPDFAYGDFVVTNNSTQ
jgi:uncharacterized repeat protein (TIGR02059 family)